MWKYLLETLTLREFCHVDMAVECWNCHPMFIYFFVFCWIEKKGEMLWNFCNEIPNRFLILKLPQNSFHNNIKKYNNRNNLILNTNFNILWRVSITKKYHCPKYAYICLFLFCRMWIVGAKNACSGSSQEIYNQNGAKTRVDASRCQGGTISQKLYQTHHESAHRYKRTNPQVKIRFLMFFPLDRSKTKWLNA